MHCVCMCVQERWLTSFSILMADGLAVVCEVVCATSAFEVTGESAMLVRLRNSLNSSIIFLSDALYNIIQLFSALHHKVIYKVLI